MNNLVHDIIIDTLHLPTGTPEDDPIYLACHDICIHELILFLEENLGQKQQMAMLEDLKRLSPSPPDKILLDMFRSYLYSIPDAEQRVISRLKATLEQAVS